MLVRPNPMFPAADPLSQTTSLFSAPVLPRDSLPDGAVVPIPAFPVVVTVVKAPLLAVVDPIAPGEAHGTSAEEIVPTETGPPDDVCFK